MLTQDSKLATTTNLYLKDFVPSIKVPPSYKVTEEELGELLKSPQRLEVLTLTYTKPKIDEKDLSIEFVPTSFYRYPHLFRSSILGKVFFPEEHLDKLDNSYLKKLETFLEDLNNEDNLLGEGFQENYLMLKKVSDGNIKTTIGHLEVPKDGIVVWIV